MKVAMFLPALTEATSPFWRPIKYSLFPPLGLATLAGYLPPDAEVSIQDEHVEPLATDDTPDVVVIQVYITSATRAYRLADYYRRRGAHVALGGLHVTSLPEEAAGHADTIFLGPGEERKYQNLRRSYAAAVHRLHDLGVMINGSFVFGMDGDDSSVFARTVDWAIEHGVETATFHILTPYPGTALHQRMAAQGRLTTRAWDRYDTRHAVFTPARMSAAALEAGYHAAYRDFYRWGAIARGAAAQKFEPAWDLVIRARRTSMMVPVLETLLNRDTRLGAGWLRGLRQVAGSAGATVHTGARPGTGDHPSELIRLPSRAADDFHR